jgi:hypothetical protein
MVETFDADQTVSAVFGAYDLTPSAPGLVSQYRNLLHRYVHERDAGSSVTFWTGCGAVRASVFASCGGFDEAAYANTSIEDIELGYRMSGLGHRILLRPEIQGTHLKQWTFRSMVATDLRARGIPWARLLLSRKVRPAATLNLRLPEQCATLAVGLACLALAVWLVTGERIWLAVAVVGVMAMLVLNAPLLSWFARHRGWWFAARAAPLRVVYYVLNGKSVIVALLLPAAEQRDGSSRAPNMVAPSGSSAN